MWTLAHRHASDEVPVLARWGSGIVILSLSFKDGQGGGARPFLELFLSSNVFSELGRVGGSLWHFNATVVVGHQDCIEHLQLNAIGRDLDGSRCSTLLKLPLLHVNVVQPRRLLSEADLCRSLNDTGANLMVGHLLSYSIF